MSLDITLPAGLRIEVVDNTNLNVPVGTKATLAFNENISSRKHENGVMCLVDGDTMNSVLPMNQCKIITDNFKKSFKPPKKIENTYKIENCVDFSTINNMRIFDNIDVEFEICDRDLLISIINDLIEENPEKENLVEKLNKSINYLEKSNDEYILKKVDKHKFIAFDLEPKRFNDACEKILEANEKAKSENQKLAEKIVKLKDKALVESDTGMVNVTDVYIEFDGYNPASLNFSYKKENGMLYTFDWDFVNGFFKEEGNGEYRLIYDINKEGEILISLPC